MIVSENKLIENNKIHKNLVITKTVPIMNYIIFKNNPTIITKYKLPELKEIARENKLHISGTKQVLINRIITNFNRISKTIIIQKTYRGYLVRESFRLRGSAFKNRALCVNSSDFFTLEPLNDIDFRQFFSYQDDTKFYYGFDINSIFELLKKSVRVNLLNPYNREKIESQIINKIQSLGNKIRILFPDILEPILRIPDRNILVSRPLRTPRYGNSSNYDHSVNNAINEGNRQDSILQRITTPEIRALEVIRMQPVSTRILELFMEIDQLGNYTQSEWFSGLLGHQYISLYRLLSNIWRRLPLDIRSKICILGDPFLNIFQRLNSTDELTFERIQESCLIVCENMVFTGIDIEYRKIGALHVLSALTVISINARRAIPWLYESVL